ncbi:MAG: O-antigen ligase family protein [Pseudolabrys sp.]|nr:O-antigen ligase family protein [Pseudolabrys sp.]
MITASELAAPYSLASSAPAKAPGIGLREQLLRLNLFIALASSSLAFIEPAPYDALVIGMILTAMIAGVRMNRITLALFLLLLIWNVSGLFSLINVVSEPSTVPYVITSFYMAAAAIRFASMLTDKTMERLAVLRAGYTFSAVICALAGIAGYLHLSGYAYDHFTLYDRALGFFKDPNVFGPYLIWPALVLIARMQTERISLVDLALTGILLVGLFFSFSRGAWLHFVLSGTVMTALLILTAPTYKSRMRIMLVCTIAIGAALALFAALLSVSSIGDMLTQRAQLLQSYDVGEGGRFRLQELAFGLMFDKPFGLGPLEFSNIFNVQQHNSYLQAFLVYGWVGGVIYPTMVAVTLVFGLRAAFVRTPWQIYLIVALAGFAGEAAESFIIDTDHWRHYFLILGLVWGLSGATIHYTRSRNKPASAIV